MKRILIGALLGLSLSSCILMPAPPAAVDPVHVEVLLDVSGSYQLRKEALESLTELVDSLRGGDMITVRSLASVSHREGGILLDTALPALGPEPATMDVKGIARFRELQSLADSVKLFLTQRLEEMADIPNSSRTDIIGGLVVAVESLQHDELDRRKLLVVFTDGMDNGPNKDARFALDMSQVNVVFAHFDPTGGLEDRMRLKDYWTNKISGEWAARSLEFLPPTRALELDRYRVEVSTEEEVG